MFMMKSKLNLTGSLASLQIETFAVTSQFSFKWLKNVKNFPHLESFIFRTVKILFVTFQSEFIFRLWPNEKLQCVVSLGLGRFDGHLYNYEKTGKSGKASTADAEAKPLSLAQKFSRIVDSATGEISYF